MLSSNRWTGLSPAPLSTNPSESAACFDILPKTRPPAAQKELKEYAIGIDVFDKHLSYDTRIDTNVRTEARRLRAELAEYYASDGVADPLRIDLPKGAYALVFQLRHAADGAAAAARRRLRMWGPGILVAVAGVAWVLWNHDRQKTQGPTSLAVLPFADLSPDKANE